MTHGYDITLQKAKLEYHIENSSSSGALLQQEMQMDQLRFLKENEEYHRLVIALFELSHALSSYRIYLDANSGVPNPTPNMSQEQRS